jgi:hypothetical protein
LIGNKKKATITGKSKRNEVVVDFKYFLEDQWIINTTMDKTKVYCHIKPDKNLSVSSSEFIFGMA